MKEDDTHAMPSAAISAAALAMPASAALAMLTYFPTPYSGEWWYSVLCRYHVRSGNPKQQTTIKELFPGRVTAAMGSVFPNSTIKQLVTRLPSKIFDIETIILEHTLFSYYTRFYPIQKKQEVLAQLCLGETIVITSIRRFSDLSNWTPRYCPQCVAEDREKYGEAYWHIVHQIPLMALCPAHGCPLLTVEEVDPSRLDSIFYPLECLATYPPPNTSGTASSASAAAIAASVTSTEFQLCKILYEYTAMPLEFAPTEGYSNLALTLSNMGYGVIQKNSPHTILDAKRVYRDMVEVFGAELVEQVFGGENSICTINRICKWGMASPERYALLQCFAGIDTEVVFSTNRIKERYEDQLLALQATGVVYGRKQLAEQLGVTTAQLELLAKKYGIRPFWTQNGVPVTERRRKINFSLNEEELELFKAALKDSGFRYDSHFARRCVMEYIKEHFGGGTTDGKS